MRLVVTRRNRDAVLSDAKGDLGQSAPNDSYRERLIKYIPVETIALFIAVYGITYYLYGTGSWYPIVARWCLILGFICTVLYLWKVENITDLVQLGISAIGFLIWVCALGVITVTSLPFYNAIVAGLLLFAYVFIAPLIDGVPEVW
jgi:membrane-bound ClpP family serine protease